MEGAVHWAACRVGVFVPSKFVSAQITNDRKLRLESMSRRGEESLRSLVKSSLSR